MLTQEVEVGNENLGIGIVTQARYVRETLAMLDQPVQTAGASAAGLSGAPAAAVLSTVHGQPKATPADLGAADK